MDELDHAYMMLKLVTGETLLGTLVHESEEYFTILYPIEMKSYKIDTNEQKKEYFAGVQWCPFTDDRIFQIYKQDIVVLKPLNDSTTSYYKRLVDIDEELMDTIDTTIVTKGTSTIH